MEIILGALTEAVFEVIVEDLAQRPGLANLREKLSASPEKKALHRALAGAYKTFKQKYPDLTEAFFDEHFLLEKPEVSRELAKLLTPDQNPNQMILEELWKEQFTFNVHYNISEAITYFISILEQEVKAQVRLKPFVDSRALDQLYVIAQGTIRQVENQQEVVVYLREIRDLLTETKGSTSNRVSIISPTEPAILIEKVQDIPERPDKLIGRRTIISQAQRLLNKGSKVLLQGFPGTGKTALAATIATRRIADGKGPIIWLRVGKANADTLFEALARAFNAQEIIINAQGDEKIKIIRELFTKADIKLLVLDDAWEGHVLYQAMKAIPTNLPVLVTSRQRYPTFKRIEIGRLDRATSLQVLTHYADRQLKSDPVADQLCAKLGDLAFAIRIAGLIISPSVDDITPGELLKRIELIPHGLSVPGDFSEKDRESIASLLQASIKPLDINAQDALFAFGTLFAPTCTSELIALYQGIEKEKIDSALVTLERRGLVERVKAREDSVECFRVHDLCFSYVSMNIKEIDHIRGLGSFKQYIARYNKSNPENYRKLHPCISNFLEGVIWATKNGYYEHVEYFVDNLYSDKSASRFLEFQGPFSYATILLDQAVVAARELKKPEMESSKLRNLGSVYDQIGNHKRAIECINQALIVAREIKNRGEEGRAMVELGKVYAHLSQYRQAIDHYQQAVTIADEIGERSLENIALHNLAIEYRHLGEVQKSIDYTNKVLERDVESGDQHAQITDLNSLALAYQELDQHEHAIELFKKALTLAKEIGAKHTLGPILGNLGNAYFSLGEYETAITYSEQSLSLAREIGNRRREGICLGNLGNAYLVLKRFEQAAGFYQQSLEIARELSDKGGEASNLANLGSILGIKKETEKSAEYFEQALEIVRQTGEKLHEMLFLTNLASLYFELEQYARVTKCVDRGLELSRNIGNKKFESTLLELLAKVKSALGIKEGVEFYHQSLLISQQLGDKYQEASLLTQLGVGYYYLDKLEQAINYFQQAGIIFTDIKEDTLLELVNSLIVATNISKKVERRIM
jgi:tetratricopeptide (TPR) repeat protein